ncbi:MAG TPA: hypothetical protein VK753_00750 [Xanthomonadaceae bacterium]|jgi:hypothetical protein|nr:hypothetical protein [Xanthomonadaceae bacterium]
MRKGDFATAWAISDAVLRHRIESKQVCWNWPRHLQFVWRGEPLADKRVLVRCYHGLGDTIQFLRFLRPLGDIARHVTLWVQPTLLDLAAGAAGVDRVLALHDGAPEAERDVDVEIMEIPHALRVTSIPNRVPYLRSPHAAQLEPGEGVHRVGIVWEAGAWDPRRDVPLPLLRHLTGLPGVRLYSLQAGRAGALAHAVPASPTDIRTINHAATRILELDLIISVDTMAAHLAGALGRPVWTLLRADCDWRWGRDSDQTSWYPTMRLFRQQREGEWDGVLAAVCEALAKRVMPPAPSACAAPLPSSSSSSSSCPPR